MNPADTKHTRQGDPADLPIPVGTRSPASSSAIGPDTEIASGGGAVGDEVLAFRVEGGWAERIRPRRDVFAKPTSLDHPQAANLLLAGTTAADMIRVTRAEGRDNRPGARRVRLRWAWPSSRCSVRSARASSAPPPSGTPETVRRFGGEWVAYGDGLEARIRDLAPSGVDVALDCVGTDEAVDVSLALVADGPAS